MKRGDIWTVAGGPDYAGKPRPAAFSRTTLLMGQLRLSGWQGYGNCRSDIGRAVDVEAAAMILGDAAGNGQTKAGTGLFGCLTATEFLRHV